MLYIILPSLSLHHVSQRGEVLDRSDLKAARGPHKPGVQRGSCTSAGIDSDSISVTRIPSIHLFQFVVAGLRPFYSAK